MGSLVNHVMGSSTQPTPEVGMGVTFLSYTDRSPGTIASVSKSGKTITVRPDAYRRTDSNGMSESQTYEFTPQPDAPESTYTLRKNGSWVREGQPMKGGSRIAIGYRDAYYDFSF